MKRFLACYLGGKHSVAMKVFHYLLLSIAVVTAFPVNAPSSNIDERSLNDDTQEWRLIKLGPQEYLVIRENQKLELKQNNINFIDLTNHISIEDAREQGLLERPSYSMWSNAMSYFRKKITISEEIQYKYPSKVAYTKQVKSLFPQIDTKKVFENLSNFTSFYTRYYKSDSGLDSANWLYGTLEDVIEPVNKHVNISKFHHEWAQYSIIVSIPGALTDKVVIGAHQDSTNLILPNLTKAPGADDDGSGTVTIIEALRILVKEIEKGTFKPKNTLEFHFYAAEEGGSLGSIDVFSSYKDADEVVLGMLQQDMTGSTANTIENGDELHVGLVTDFTNENLNEFLKVIIDSYLPIPYHETTCGYACSDHTSAREKGYPSSFIFESEFRYHSDYIHSVMDTIDKIDFEHVAEHVKLTLAFAYELSMATDLY